MQGRVAPEHLDRAVSLLRQGGVVAFPTETYYGLAVDPFSPAALARLFELKRRSRKKPILVLIESRIQLLRLTAGIPSEYEPLMERFWPGPLSLIFPARGDLSDLLTGGTGTVGVRISSHPAAGRLLERVGGPLTATSANLAGSPPATTARQVREVFGSALDLVLDGGETPGGAGSTIVDLSAGRPLIVRSGVMAAAVLREVEKQ